MSDWIAPERLVTAATRVAMPCRWTSLRASSIWSRLCSSSISSRCRFSFFSSQFLRALASTDALRIMLEPRFLTFLRFDSDPSSASSSLCSVPDDSDLSTIKHVPQHNHKICHITTIKVHPLLELQVLLYFMEGWIYNIMWQRLSPPIECECI